MVKAFPPFHTSQCNKSLKIFVVDKSSLNAVSLSVFSKNSHASLFFPLMTIFKLLGPIFSKFLQSVKLDCQPGNGFDLELGVYFGFETRHTHLPTSHSF